MAIGLKDPVNFQRKQMGTGPNLEQNKSNTRQHTPQAMSDLSHEPRFTGLGQGSRTGGKGPTHGGGHVAQD